MTSVCIVIIVFLAGIAAFRYFVTMRCPRTQCRGRLRHIGLLQVMRCDQCGLIIRNMPDHSRRSE